MDNRVKQSMTVRNFVLSGCFGTIGLNPNFKLNHTHVLQADEAIEKLCLAPVSYKFYYQLSDGEKRKALIARAIVNKPLILILDEPTCRLDLKAKYQLIKLIAKLSQNGMTIIQVTHDLESIINETKKLIMIKNGKIFKQGAIGKIVNSKNLSKLYEIDIEVKNLYGYWNVAPKPSL